MKCYLLLLLVLLSVISKNSNAEQSPPDQAVTVSPSAAKVDKSPSESPEPQESTAKKNKPEDYQSSEQVDADVSVPFPVDI